MKQENKRNLYIAICSLIVFVLWTTLLKFIDVQQIGPLDSKVGFSTLNLFFHKLTGVNMILYTITDWLGLVPFFCTFIFAILGLIQLIKRKSILNVDYSILILGGYYIVVFALYFFFEIVVINYRPILINGILEASYPSSTTMLVLTVMPTTIIQLNSRIKNKTFRYIINIAIMFFIAFMVFGRLVSGVHWLSDIIGGILLSTGLVFMYNFICTLR